jgi:hypothetical protein
MLQWILYMRWKVKKRTSAAEELEIEMNSMEFSCVFRVAVMHVHFLTCQASLHLLLRNDQQGFSHLVLCNRQIRQPR